MQFEEGYWKKQLIAIRNGEKWRPLEVDSDGKYSRGEEKEPSTEDELDVHSKMQQARSYLNNIGLKARELETSYKANFGALSGKLKTLEKTIFPFYEDPNNPHKDLLVATAAQFPPELQMNPLLPLLTKMYVSMTELGKRHTEVLAKLNNKQALVVERRVAGPNASDTGAATPAVGKPQFVSMDAFDAIHRD